MSPLTADVATAQSGQPTRPARPVVPSLSTLPALSVLPALGSLQARLDSWSVVIVPLWLLGVFAFSARLVCGWYLVEGIRRAAADPVPVEWLARVHHLARRLDIGRPIRMVQSAVVRVPTVIGWLRPVILLPASVFTGLSPAQLEAVIAHELAHVRRHDYAVNILQTATEIVLFYHPACWWISRQVRIEREHCCDDIAVGMCGNRYVYAEALADLETMRSDRPALSLAATDGPLMRRIRRLVTPSTPAEGISPLWAAAAVPLTVLTLVLAATNVTGMQVPGAAAEQTRVPSGPRTVPNGEGVVQGQVVDARSGRPVPKATVELLGPERSATALTGDDGRFEARSLLPGLYPRASAGARIRGGPVPVSATPTIALPYWMFQADGSPQALTFGCTR